MKSAYCVSCCCKLFLRFDMRNFAEDKQKPVGKLEKHKC